MPLRHHAINYDHGWFFVTTQVAHNKTMFGVIAEGRCTLNELGRRVEARWLDLFNHRPELQPDAFVVMPNHFHAILRIRPRPGTRIPHLSRAMQIFKSIAAHDYLELLKAGRCPDIGPRLWTRSYYDDLVTGHRELEAMRAYIRENPARWEGDRFGPATTYHTGNIELLNQPCVAVVASEGGGDEAPPRLNDIVPAEWGVISTFSSRQERAVLAQCLAMRQPYIHVMPAGIPAPLPAAWQAACKADRALIMSPFPPGTPLNKQRAIWCNQYVLNHAKTLWHGTIRPGGALETLLNRRDEALRLQENPRASGAAPQNPRASGAAPQNPRASGAASPNPRASGAAPPNPRTSGAAPPNPRASGAAPQNPRASGAASPNPRASGAAPPNPRASGAASPKSRASGASSPLQKERNPTP